MRMFFQRLAFTCLLASSGVSAAAEPEHVVVFQEDGRFAAWPANGGMWAWGHEILVCYTEAAHKDVSGHTYDPRTARNMLARSLDGGETWNVQDAYEAGITGQAMDHHPGDEAEPPGDLTEPMDFTHPGFALLFQRETNRRGPAHFYCTYDRGVSWAGPWKFPELDSAGIANRTDYIVEDTHAMTAMLSIGHGRTGVARTIDGGRSWKLLSYVGPDFTRSEQQVRRNEYSLMPATLRLSPERLLTVIRHRERDRVWLTSYVSVDDARSWQRLDDPVSDHVNSPPDLLQLPDGRLVLAYVFRRHGGEGSSVCVRISTDEGRSWGNEIVLRGDEGANSDVGYPRIVVRATNSNGCCAPRQECIASVNRPPAASRSGQPSACQAGKGVHVEKPCSHRTAKKADRPVGNRSR